MIVMSTRYSVDDPIVDLPGSGPVGVSFLSRIMIIIMLNKYLY